MEQRRNRKSSWTLGSDLNSWSTPQTFYRILFTLTCLISSSLSQYQKTYQNSVAYRERFNLDSTYYLCRDTLIKQSSLTATSETIYKGASYGVLWGESAWTPEHSDFDQALVIEFGSLKNVTGIATQGRSNTKEFVQEFRIQYGTNGKEWSDYKEVNGLPKLFKANKDGDSVVRTDVDHPIIAKWIRINPTRWQDKISLRVEIYGCEYKPEVLHFNGTGMIRRELSRYPVASLKDHFRFRFKTNKENGILLYGKGSQGDYIALQLAENRLLLNIKLGGKIETTMALGSLLDDNSFHEVVLSREKRDVILSVDRVRIRDQIRGDFIRLNLDRKMYIGGVPNIDQGIVVYENFTGCIENMFVNHSNVITAMKDTLSYTYEGLGDLNYDCPTDETYLPVTFKTDKAYYRQSNKENSPNINISLEFRTYEEGGLLFYHSFTSEGHLKLYLSEGRIKVRIVSQGMPNVELDNFEQTFNDGKWHMVELSLSSNFLVTTVDSEQIETKRLLQIKTGPHTMVGGGIFGEKGFIGCIRRITINEIYKSPTDWNKEDYSSKDELAFNSCLVVDRCNPNPCEHGGACKQNSEDFYCECDGTGYSGAVCHSTLNYLSCVQYHNVNPESQYAETVIDIDGSGPLSPFPVRCEFFPDGRNVTYVGHANEEATKVDGFEEKGSFQQTIYYDASMLMMEALINRSVSCEQKLRYDCKRSRLLNTPVGENEKFSPFGYWVSRQNKIMDYWAGSLPGSQKCECGILGVCFDPDKWCNCDSGHDDWLWDGGEIIEKQFLPVRALHFGDTGNPLDRKEGRYSLGPLECDGDVLFENMITFRKADAVIELPTFVMGLSGDIYFEFKTTSTKKMVLVHSIGDNGDFIMVSLVADNKIQFEFASGKGPQGVTVDSPTKLNDNQWHSVLIERNRKEARVVVDRNTNGQVKEPYGPVRPLTLTSKLYIGASKEYTNGFVGCFRALVLNGNPVDLVTEITRHPWGMYGISVGCVGKCSQKPCMNGGSCTEGYDHFTCDCRTTPFKGVVCTDEVGVNMRPNYMIKYDFKGNYKSTIAEKIHVGFKTTDPKGFILGAFSDISQEYFTLSVTTSGHLKLVLDFGFEKQEMVFTDQNFKSGHFHDVIVERYDQGKKLRMIVDNYEPKVYNFENWLKNSTEAQFNNIRYLYIGRNETMREGFMGCISRVEFDDIIPLKLLFQVDPLSNIQAAPETIKEDFCGIEPVTLPPEEAETRKIPKVEDEKIEQYYHATSSAVLGAGLAIIFIGLVICAVLVGRHLNRHKGEYVTREDEGAHDAFDADTAVLQGRTGHLVEKKKEWFI